MDKFYSINFPRFSSISAKNLTSKEILQIKKIKSTMSFDEYAGYTPSEHLKYEEIYNIVRNRVINTNHI